MRQIELDLSPLCIFLNTALGFEFDPVIEAEAVGKVFLWCSREYIVEIEGISFFKRRYIVYVKMDESSFEDNKEIFEVKSKNDGEFLITLKRGKNEKRKIYY